jgi:hypothetical protein
VAIVSHGLDDERIVVAAGVEAGALDARSTVRCETPSVGTEQPVAAATHTAPSQNNDFIDLMYVNPPERESRILSAPRALPIATRAPRCSSRAPTSGSE